MTRIHHNLRVVWHGLAPGEAVAQASTTACPEAGQTVPPRRRPRGFSLLETTIAVGILGVGLIMVAAVFPAALTQHRMSVEQARAAELVSKAEALLNSRFQRTSLWVDPGVSSVPGLDSPWYLLPTVNMNAVTGVWDPMVGYADAINGVTGSDPINNPLNPLVLFPPDILSDRIAPATDSDLMTAPNRAVWYGFYRREAAGTTTFATAICKQRRNQLFVEQDLTVGAPFANPAYAANRRRLPVPWRVSVGYVGGNILSNASAPPLLGGTLGLARLAPVGTKIMLSGGSYADGASPAIVPAGTILTVSDSIDDFTVEVVGDRAGLPLYDTAPAGPPNFTFDVWVFPPSVENGDWGRESPLLDWKVLQ
ncbi:MAG TPA: prepilin-type N-terminal cleavage/methylation domain-containing protein [Phycisphaerae bacterium]|nr:prepilin-type N-terminal cleavage/methylation domain-containing protein [Phycisphaerae bacterium]